MSSRLAPGHGLGRAVRDGVPPPRLRLDLAGHLMTQSYIEFEPVPSLTRKTGVWSVRSTSGTALGTVKFYGRWRCFVFYPYPDTLYNAGCLDDIARFCSQETARWREGLKARV